MKNILKDSLIIITGFGKSGTTILGKVLGSMEPAIYCFEPPIMKYLREFGMTDVPAKLLFETHFLQEIQGRGNMNVFDDSYCGNYTSIGTLIKNQQALRLREDAIKLLNEKNYKYIVKSTELQHHMELACFLFPGVRFVHIIRNGFNAVNSAILRGWYTDNYCNSAIVEDMVSDLTCDIPGFIDLDCWGLWPEWNAETRAACAWRCSVVDGIRFKNNYPDKCVQFKYEDFTASPRKYTRYLEREFDLSSTFLTIGYMGNIYNSSPGSKKIAAYIDKIVEPERTKFFRLNEKLGYVC